MNNTDRSPDTAVEKHQGTVFKSTGSWYLVQLENKKFVEAKTKGKLKFDKDITSTNPIAVGDRVEVAIQPQQTPIIFSIQKRNNYIIRASPHNVNQKHIIAANLDQVALVVSLSQPCTATGFIDRFLLTAEAYQIPVLILVNKNDRHQTHEITLFNAWQSVYEKLGYQVISLSAFAKKDIRSLTEKLVNKTTLFSGQSGVGKSTLINGLIPSLQLKTADVSLASGKGTHTTTFAEMFALPSGGKIIDTPGVKEFGLIHFEKEEIAHFFPEMRARIGECKFHNCLHHNEPSCAIKNAVAQKEIADWRYQNYLSILEDL